VLRSSLDQCDCHIASATSGHRRGGGRPGRATPITFRRRSTVSPAVACHKRDAGPTSHPDVTPATAGWPRHKAHASTATAPPARGAVQLRPRATTSRLAGGNASPISWKSPVAHGTPTTDRRCLKDWYQPSFIQIIADGDSLQAVRPGRLRATRVRSSHDALPRLISWEAMREEWPSVTTGRPRAALARRHVPQRSRG